jgi:hypothetical protein
MTARRKTSPAPLIRAASTRSLAAASTTSRTTYGAILAKARAAGIFALCTLAPLGALAGSVSACGAAAPVQPYPYTTTTTGTGAPAPTDPNAVTAPPTGAGTAPAPLSTSIAPPSANPPSATPQ